MKLSIVILFSAVSLCQGQGTFTVTFDEPPIVPAGSYRQVRYYYEAGMWFRLDTNFFLNMQLTRQGGSQPLPDNGTTYLIPVTHALFFSLTNGGVFDLVSVDLSRSSGSMPDPTGGAFVGYLADGSTVSTNFSTSGLVFQTFQFGPEFSGLTLVEMASTSWALDNLVFSVIPEPSFAGLIFLGGGVWLCNRTIRRKLARTRSGKRSNASQQTGD